MTKVNAAKVAQVSEFARNKEFAGLGGGEVRALVLKSRDVSLVKMAIIDADTMAKKYAGHVWKADRWVALGTEFRSHLATIGVASKAEGRRVAAGKVSKADILAQLAALTAQLEDAA